MNKIIIINGPNINLLGERDESQYGSITFNELKEKCLKKSKDLQYYNFHQLLLFYRLILFLFFLFFSSYINAE